MGEKGNLPIGSSEASGLPKVGHPVAAKDPGAGLAAKDLGAGTAAKDLGAGLAAKDAGGFATPPPAPPAGTPPQPGLPGMGGLVAGRDGRRDDDPPATGA
jgi:hypothetical protein